MRRAPPTVSKPTSQDIKATNNLTATLLGDLSTSLKSMEHSFWVPYRSWIRRVNFVCYFAHLVAVSIASISMDVVQEEEEEDTSLVSIKHGSVYVSAKYDSKSAVLECSVRLFQRTAIRCVAPTVDEVLEIGSTELKIVVPLSRNSDDERAPIPTSCSVSCGFINVEIDFLHLLKKALSESSQCFSKTESGSTTESRPMEPNRNMVILRLIEAIPDDMGFVLHRLEVKLTNNMDPAVAQTDCAIRLGKTSVRLTGSAHRQNKQGDESDDRVLGDADEEGNGNDDVAILSCNSRVSGEAKGLSVAITPDLRPWIACIQNELEHRQPVESTSTPTHASEECSSSESQHPSIFDTMQMEVQFKVLQTEVLFTPLEKECVVLASGVPSLQIVAEEINIFVHPFIGEESLGVRSKANIQSSRLKVFCLSDKMSKTCFISLDFTRVFVDPVSFVNANQSPAEVEMETEWLEVKWTPDGIHSIAGVLELGIYIASPFLKEHSSDDEAFDDGWDINARNRVPDLKSIEEVVADKLCESWLERIYPLWLEELQEQDLRAQILEEQVTTLKLTNADLLCEDAYQEMKVLLVEKNSKIYFQKVKKLQIKHRQHPRDVNDETSGSLFCICIGHLSTDVAFEGDTKKTVRRLQILDEASDSITRIFARSGRAYSTYTPDFDLLEGIQLDVSLSDLAVQMRSFSTPLLVYDRPGLAGHVIVAVCSAAGVVADSEKFNFAARLRCFADLSVEVVHLIVYFSPGHLYTLDEMACLAQQFLPLMLLDVDKHHNTSPWVILRRLFHGKVSIALRDAAIRLLCSLTSFDVTEYLEVSIQRLALDYSTGKIDLSICRLTTKIDPGSLSNIAESSNIRTEVWIKWYQAYKTWGTGENGDTVMLDSCASRILRADDRLLDQFSVTQSLKMCQASDLSVFIRGKMCPTNFDIGLPATKVQDIQVRICTPQSGSRGESLVSVKIMVVKVGGVSEHIPTHDDASVTIPSSSTTKAPNERAESFSGAGGDATEGSRGRTKKNILEHFSIQQHNPCCFRDSGHDASTDANITEQDDGQNFQAEFVDEFRRLGFLMGLSAREARILVTLGAVETLIDLVENWMRVIAVCLPELLGPLDDLLLPNDPTEMDESHADAGSSPRKTTSLAEDPKFGAIFYQSIAREKSSGSFSSIPSSLKTLSGELSPMPRTESSDTLTQTHTNDPSQTALPEANIVESFFMVKFTDCQISVQDHLHKSSVLLALNCGSLKDSISSDSSHGFIDIKVDGLQLSTTPLDIDVILRIIWLKALSDGSYCPSSYGLLRQVIAPVPAKAAIWVDRDVAISHKIDLQIPTIQVGLSVVSKDILQNLALAMTTLITTKLAGKTAPDYSRMLQANHLADANSRSIQNLRALKKQLKWRIAHLHWRQTCRWNYYISERANVAFAAAESNRNLSFEVETSPFFRQRKTSAASISSMTTDMSISGSGAMNCDTDHFTDDLQRLVRQYESICEVLRGVVKSEQKKKQPLPNVELDFHLQSASLTLSGTNMDIARVSMSSLRFKMEQFKDQSGSFTLTLQDLSTHNLCPGTKYPDLLQPSSASNTWGGGNAFFRVDAEITAPVGGITVVKHFEVNVHPLQVCITQEVILRLVAFFSSHAASNSTMDEKRDEIRSKFLQARPASSPSDGLVGSALKKAVKVAGKAAHPLGLSRHKEEADHTSSSSARTRSLNLIHEEASAWISKAITNTSEPNETQLLLRGDEDALHAGDPIHDSSAEREISEMKDRAKTNILFKRIRIGTIEVVVTYKNKKSNHHNQQTLEDMRGFEVKIHALVYCDKTCSIMDLMLRIRRDVILDILSQVGRNFTNIGNFLHDQFDITRWAPFDALAPLKTLSTTVTSLATVSSVSPAPSSLVATAGANNASEVSPRKRAATAPTASHAQDTTQKFQLELPETHRALRKKHTSSNPRPAETVHRRLPAAVSSSSPATSPRQDEQGRDQGMEPLDTDQLPHHHHQSTVGKAKKALVHLFSKKKSGNALTSPSSPPASQQEQHASITFTPNASQ
ncbi:Fmp27, c-terminal, partial [Globisporangium splendens]